ncbi:MAG: fluoride efflux transporter CrcB [Ignavibacteriaceae bacterium]
MNYILVSIGAALGGALRYWLSNYVYKFLPVTFPYGTLAVNFIGSFILGFIIFFLDDKELITPGFRLFLTVGFCGGFTTFSTFSLETFNLFRNSEILLGFGNILLSILLCIGGVFAAYLLSKIAV